MKKEMLIRTFGVTMIIISASYFVAYAHNDYKECNPSAQVFVNGEVLLPDYVHSDTLVVINAKLLNEEISYCDGSDGSYSDLLGEGTVNIADYKDYMNLAGK